MNSWGYTCACPPPEAGRTVWWVETGRNFLTGYGVGGEKSLVSQIETSGLSVGLVDQTILLPKAAQFSGSRAYPRIFQEFRLQAVAAAATKEVVSRHSFQTNVFILYLKTTRCVILLTSCGQGIDPD